jgi:hypothetical protein
VTDEVSGEEIDAPDAYFVRSQVVTTPATGNRIHVFHKLEDAQRHAQTYRGTVLDAKERPVGQSGWEDFDQKP